MLSTRLSIIAILIVATIAILMGNLQPVEVSFLVYSRTYPLFYVMGFSILLGSLLTLLFFSLLSRDKKLKEKLKKVQAEKNEAEKVVNAQKKEEKAKNSFFKKNKKELSIPENTKKEKTEFKNTTKENPKDENDETYRSPFL